MTRTSLALVMLLLASSPARPCSRAMSPFEDLHVALAVADVTALVEVIAIGGGVAHVKVVRSLAGHPFAADAKLRVLGPHSAKEAPMDDFCSIKTMEVGRRYVVIAWDPTRSAPDVLHLLDSHAGVLADDDDTHARLQAALAQPAPSSAWRISGDVAARVVRQQNAAEVDLLVIVRNLGRGALTYSHRAWPEALQSRCTLALLGPGGPVDAVSAPIAHDAIVDYFSQHAPAPYTLPIASGDIALIALPRVTTAAPGWGFKEELGFRFYPIVTHGPHTLAVACERHFAEPRTIATGPMTLEL